jgi:hypothetical protein
MGVEMRQSPNWETRKSRLLSIMPPLSLTVLVLLYREAGFLGSIARNLQEFIKEGQVMQTRPCVP